MLKSTSANWLKHEIPSLGLGTWQLGSTTIFGGSYSGYGQVSEAEAIKIIHSAYDLGIRFLDTADSYGKGLAERIIGKASQGFKNELIVCSKFGNRENEKGASYQDFSASWLNESVDQSLQRLQRDYLDVLLLHSPPDDFNWSEYDPGPFEKLKTSGKIRAYGVSAKSVTGALNVIKSGFGGVIEFIYNMLDRRADEQLIPLAAQRGVFQIARAPIASGFISPKYFDQFPEFDKTDWRCSFSSEAKQWLVESVRKLKHFDAYSGGISCSAIKFCLANDKIDMTIPGVRSVEQLTALEIAFHTGGLLKEAINEIKQKVPEVFPGWR